LTHIKLPNQFLHLSRNPSNTERHNRQKDIFVLIWLHEGQTVDQVAFSGYVDQRRDIPRPSKPESGQRTVALPPQVAMKLAIYQSMRDQRVTQAALGERMGIDGRQVRRILDLDHNTSLTHLVQALKCLGKHLVIDIQEAA
jgi:antitoxin HicB